MTKLREATPNCGDLRMIAAIHEAGHAVAEYVGGLFPLGIELRDVPGAGRVHTRDLRPSREAIDEFVIGCLGGWAAEQVLCGPNQAALDSSAQDRVVAMKELTRFGLDQDLAPYETRAEELIREHELAVRALASEVLQRGGRVFGEELIVLLERLIGGRLGHPCLASFAGPQESRMVLLHTADYLTPGAVGLSPQGEAARSMLERLRHDESVLVELWSNKDAARAAGLVGNPFVLVELASEHDEESVLVSATDDPRCVRLIKI